MLHTVPDLTGETISDTLEALDMSNLWKPNPKNWHYIEQMPLLGTGKLDYKAMKESASKANG